MEMIDFVKEKVVNNKNNTANMENLYYRFTHDFAHSYLKESSLVNDVCHYLIGDSIDEVYTLKYNEKFGRLAEGWEEFTVWNHSFGQFNGRDILFFANGKMKLMENKELYQYYKNTHNPEDTCKQTLENWGFFDEVSI